MPDRPDSWQGFPGSRRSKNFPGDWRYGVDFAESSGAMRVLAVHLGGDDEKYGTHWIGPVELNEESAAILEAWAESCLQSEGGYVHLFPADGDASEDLHEWAVDNDLQGEGDE